VHSRCSSKIRSGSTVESERVSPTVASFRNRGTTGDDLGTVEHPVHV
jgi:hypothetical protein